MLADLLLDPISIVIDLLNCSPLALLLLAAHLFKLLRIFVPILESWAVLRDRWKVVIKANLVNLSFTSINVLSITRL